MNKAENIITPVSTEILIERRTIDQTGDQSGDQLPPGLPGVLRDIYLGRGVASREDVELALGSLLPSSRLRGSEAAARLLADAMQQRQRILIVGDFDADGATSCALAVLALRTFGHRDVDFLVPNRFEYGYGLTPEIVELAKQREPGLIVTVDNGISSLSGVAAARRAGIRVVVTDHHLPGERLPEADVIVNPNQPDDEFPSKAIAGVGVIFYVLAALRARLRKIGWFEKQRIEEPNMAAFLDLVALGTVADVVPLDRNNRVLVKHGLARIRSGHCRPGILALLEVAGRNPRRAGASDMGFAVGPRLNAAGRLSDMTLGIECLLTEDPTDARQLAAELERLNRARREIEQDMQQDAEALLQALHFDGIDMPWGLCLFQESWHQGVIGILASRIRERHHRPVIAFAGADGDTLKGSARSIPGLHIRDALDRVAAIHPELLQKFGGHAMAAGMSIRRVDFEAFATAFDQVVRQQIEQHQLRPRMLTDGRVPVDELTPDTARAIAEGGPWGQGFAEPLFDDVFEIRSQRIVAEKHWKLVLQHPDGGPLVDGIAFNSVETHPRPAERLRLVYHLELNEWRGQENLQLRIDHMEPAG